MSNCSFYKHQDAVCYLIACDLKYIQITVKSVQITVLEIVSMRNTGLLNYSFLCQLLITLKYKEFVM